MRHSISRSGFTLVELMIVIAIIGILAAALFPAISGYRDRAWDVDTRSKVRLIATAASMRFADTGQAKILGGWHSGWSYGWMDLENGSQWGAYTRSAIHVLEDNGYLTPGKIPTIATNPLFMYYPCSGENIFSVSAKLRQPNKEDLFSIAYACYGTHDGTAAGNATYDQYGQHTAITVWQMCPRWINTSGSGTFYSCDGRDVSDNLYNHILQHAQPYPGAAYWGIW
jgi:prepilin-type N-terminal cleavage/methylation domain-containing protein